VSALALHPALVILVVLVVAAAACFGLGTMRGSWRVWLVGYVLFAAALGVGFIGQRAARRAPAIPPASTPVTEAHP
jgi:lipopolysaccharide export LptBFGC system permease protein LptF